MDTYQSDGSLVLYIAIVQNPTANIGSSNMEKNNNPREMIMFAIVWIMHTWNYVVFYSSILCGHL